MEALGEREDFVWKSLHDAVTTLAFQGIPNAPGEALRRLCAGEWVARGEWAWTAHGGGTYRASENGPIPAERLQALQDALAKELPGFDDDEVKWRLKTGQAVRFCNPAPLPYLGSLGPKAPSDEMAEWAWRYDRLETALLTKAGQEEWFSAVSVEVCEAPNDGQASPSPPLTKEVRNKGGRPATHDWEALLLAMAGRCYVDGWEPASPAAVIKAMQEWTSEQGLPEPSPSVARPKAKAFFDAFTAWQIAANENLR